MKSYHLLKGNVELTNTHIKVSNLKPWNMYKNKGLAIVAGLYIFNRLDGKLERGFDSILDWVFVSLVYVPITLFVLHWMYMEFIKRSWTNSLKVENISSVRQTVDEDDPLNTTLFVKGNFSTLNLTFRTSEGQHTEFLEHLEKLNSRFKLQHERI